MAIPVKNRRSRRQRSLDTDEEFSVVAVVVTMVAQSVTAGLAFHRRKRNAD